MSPEQARGQAVDKRTDVWAFGCCLYEALAGRKPFRARSISDMMAEVLKSDPDYALLPAETPADILALLRRCLEKDPRRRLRDIGDIAIRLEETTETSRLRAPVSQAAPPEASGKARPGRTAKAAGLVVIIALAAGLGYFLPRMGFLDPVTEQTTASVPAGGLKQDGEIIRLPDESLRSLAILPFNNLKQDDEIGWLSEAMAKAIRQKLGRIDGIVVKRGSVPLHDLIAEGKSRSEAAAQLKVDALVSGSFLQHEGSLRFNVSLIHGGDGRDDPLGEFTNDDVANVFEVQNEVALAIAERIRASLSGEEKARIAESNGIDPGAYRDCQEGIYACKLKTEEGYARARRLFLDAIRKDPGYGEPVAMLAGIPWMQSLATGLESPPAAAILQSRAIMDQYAGNLREESPLDSLRGRLAMEWDRDWYAAEQYLRRDLDANPDLLGAHAGYARYLSRVEGRHREALDLFDLAKEVEPEDIQHLTIRAEIRFSAGEYETCLAVLEEILRKQPERWQSTSLKAKCLIALSRHEEAVATAAQAVELSGDNPVCLEVHALVLARSGQPERAQEELDKLGNIVGRSYGIGTTVALVEYCLGNADRAFAWLDVAAPGRGGSENLQLRDALWIEMMGDDPRYWAVIDRLNFPALPVYHRHYEKEQAMRFGKAAEK